MIAENVMDGSTGISALIAGRKKPPLAGNVLDGPTGTSAVITGREKSLVTFEETEKWRQRVEKEENAARQDKIKWGYMHGDAHMVLQKAEPVEFQGHKEYMEKLVKEHMKQEELFKKSYSEFFTGTKKDELTVPVKPSGPVPQTTSGMITWRIGKGYNYPMNDVHDTGHYKGDICKRLGWPLEGTI